MGYRRNRSSPGMRRIVYDMRVTDGLTDERVGGGKQEKEVQYERGCRTEFQVKSCVWTFV